MSKQEQIRFKFGKNWLDYSNRITHQEIMEAKKSLFKWLPIDSLQGKKFLDIGSGSGLFSLAAWKAGVKELVSFDYDSDSVKCTKNLCNSMPQEAGRHWNVERGDVLDNSYMNKHFNSYDVVYSWGVLHHTGNMKKALYSAGKCVRSGGGYLFISIYNDQGLKSKIWKWVKKRYNMSGLKQKKILLFLSSLYIYRIKKTILLFGKKGQSIKNKRGMSAWNDLVDWVGGYPFEYATADEIISFYLAQGFSLIKLEAHEKKDADCNQFLFMKR